MIDFSFEPEAGHMNGAGHVDNVEIYRWFNEQRLQLFRLMDLPPGGTYFPALANSHIDFNEELFDHGPIRIYSFVSRVGSKSFTVEQEMSQAGRLCAKSRAVSVKFHRDEKVSVALSEKERALMTESYQVAQSRI